MGAMQGPQLSVRFIQKLVLTVFVITRLHCSEIQGKNEQCQCLKCLQTYVRSFVSKFELKVVYDLLIHHRQVRLEISV